MVQAGDGGSLTGNATVGLKAGWGRPRRYIGYLGGLCGPEAARRNEAAQAVVHAAAAALEGSYTPTLVRVGGVDTALLVYRDPYAGWVYRFLDLPPLPPGGARQEPVGYHAAGDWTTSEQAIRAGRRHLAQYLQGRGVAFEVALEAIDPANQQDRQEFAELEGFQRAYRAARAQGLSDEGDQARHSAYEHLQEHTPALPTPTTVEETP
jgi:hypothetical protein